MALVDIYACWLGETGTLRKKFVGACLKAAYDISNEDPGTANHVNRIAWADVVLSGTRDEVEQKAIEMLRYGVASNATIQAAGDAATDNDVQYVVNSQINILATE